jgi:trypsin
MAETLHRLARFGAIAVLITGLSGLAGVSVASASVPDASAPGAGSSAPRTAGASPSVVGGSDASTADYPYVVALTTSSGFQFCGGSLAAPNKVVTAAHCTKGERPSAIRVVAGRTRLSTGEGTVARVSSIWVHPRYTSATVGYDVSVLTLDRNLTYRTVPLASGSDTGLYRAGIQSTILGWGLTSENGSDTSDVLQKATVPLTSDSDCSNAYSGYNATAMVCAGYPQGGVDTCQGDSGGPLVAGGKLIGITSWGEGCAEAGYPGVYTRVLSYSNDIAAQLGG